MDLTLYKKYAEELTEELEIDDFNMYEVQKKMPCIKHKWVARLIDHKIELDKLKKLRNKAIDTLVEKLRKENPVTLSDTTLKQQAQKNEIVEKIDDKISEHEILIDYLTKIEKVCSSTSYDIKNLVDIKKLELN
jgi:hypothetical protein